MIDFALPPTLEAHEPPEARGRTRDGVRLLVSRSSAITHHEFRELPALLFPGDLLVINTSATLPSAVWLDKLAIHFSTPASDQEGVWLVELRRRTGKASAPYGGGSPGEWFPLPGGATLTLITRQTDRLWRARLNTEVVPYLRRHGRPIRYGYVRKDWPASAYQTVFSSSSISKGAVFEEETAQAEGSFQAGEPFRAERSFRSGGPVDGGLEGSAEMPSAGRPFTDELVTRLVSRGVLLTPLTLHTGVASPEAHEPPYAERFAVPEATASLVNHVRARGGRVIAVGTTVVRALETAVDSAGQVWPAQGWTEHLVTPSNGVRVVDGLLTGLHEPRSSHLQMLTAIAGTELVERTYAEALDKGYLWHEFGDLNLLLP
ncbi:MAG: S-adenosylmethionine:tRNA ribosyltransferase-isomerase [Streptosporangiaceae bacterium]|jgi:S-adenosylmethionine:tRNA ribosyltransferase-isomerase|nr:queuosine biosynthesis protein [Streptosporangiaceae bacterium]MDX6432062.1 S-adenosylmethionine:tRNA ribosyltransferase-isomerase [Streptosporangiaceae bacterium]